MTETIITGVLSAASAITVCVITAITQGRRTEALISYKLDELTKKVEKHNSLVERMYGLEQTVAVQDALVDSMEKRLEDVEKEVHK